MPVRILTPGSSRGCLTATRTPAPDRVGAVRTLALALLLATAVAAPQASAAARVSPFDARMVAEVLVEQSEGQGLPLKLGRCTRFGARVDCAVGESLNRCALVVSVTARAGSLHRTLYGCPVARRPSAAQRAAAQLANSTSTFLLGCDSAILFCPPGYGPRPNEPHALLMPSPSLLQARPFAPRPLRQREVDAVVYDVISELSRLPIPETGDVQWDIRGCTRIATAQIDCELGDTGGGPACLLVRATLRPDGWLAADPLNCPAGPSRVDDLIARRSAFCLSPNSPRRTAGCRPPWRGVQAYIGPCAMRQCEPAKYGRSRVCWQITARPRKTTKCIMLHRP